MNFLNQNIIDGKNHRVTLRPLNAEDADALFQIYSDPEVMRFYDLLPFTDIKQAGDLLTRMENDRKSGQTIQWGILLAGENKLIGTCGFRFDHPNRIATLGFELGRLWWRRGLMKEALVAMIEHTYTAWEINRLQATTDLDNAASIVLLKSLGFQEEGILRQWGFWKSDFHDVRMFSIVRSEYRTQSERLVGWADKPSVSPTER